MLPGPLRLCGVCQEYVRQSDHHAAHDPKRCAECDKLLSLSQFDEHSSAVDGFRRTCRGCSRRVGTPSRAISKNHMVTPTASIDPGIVKHSPTSISKEERSKTYLLIGTLVHRAVLWPLIRPLTGTQLDVFKDAHFLAARARTGCRTIERALRPLVDGGSAADFDTALGLVNLEGPQRVGSFGDLWQRLSPQARIEVLRDLGRIVEAAATGVSNFIRSIGLSGDLVTCAWSEVPLFAIDGFFKPEESDDLRLRADLVIWRERGDIAVLDIKVGLTDPPDWVRKANEDQVAGYVAEVRRRVSSSHRVEGNLLYVGRGAGRNRFRLERVETPLSS